MVINYNCILILGLERFLCFWFHIFYAVVTEADTSTKLKFREPLVSLDNARENRGNYISSPKKIVKKRTKKTPNPT